MFFITLLKIKGWLTQDWLLSGLWKTPYKLATAESLRQTNVGQKSVWQFSWTDVPTASDGLLSWLSGRESDCQTGLQSFSQEDTLEKEMATHSSILAWIIPWTEEPGKLYSLWGRKGADTTERATLTHFNQGYQGGRSWLHTEVLPCYTAVTPQIWPTSWFW